MIDRFQLMALLAHHLQIWLLRNISVNLSNRCEIILAVYILKNEKDLILMDAKTQYDLISHGYQGIFCYHHVSYLEDYVVYFSKDSYVRGTHALNIIKYKVTIKVSISSSIRKTYI